MIWYLSKGLRSLVRVEIKQRGQELNSFEKLVKKTVNAEAKAALRPRFYAWETNQYCRQGSLPLVAKANTKNQTMKDLRVEEPKSRP